SSLSISQGSVSNILRAYKSKYESTTSLGQNCGQISNEHTTCAAASVVDVRRTSATTAAATTT
ncbi:MAG: hypothetical protein WBZ36_21320, partial [Candidatus Nitrosopolaris sp.]